MLCLAVTGRPAGLYDPQSCASWRLELQAGLTMSDWFVSTVKPLLSGHPRDPYKCPLNRGCTLNRGLLNRDFTVHVLANIINQQITLSINIIDNIINKAQSLLLCLCVSTHASRTMADYTPPPHCPLKFFRLKPIVMHTISL